MANDQRRYVPPAPAPFARFDQFSARDDTDAAEIARLRREVIEARRQIEVDQLALEDAADRTEFVVRHTLVYRVGSVVEHYGKGKVGRALERHTAGRTSPAPPSYPSTLVDQYSRWFTLARRQRWEQPARWADDTVALVVVGDGAGPTIDSFNVQRRTTDLVLEVADARELPAALDSLSDARPAPRWLIVVTAGSTLTPDAISQLIAFAGDGDVAVSDEDVISEGGAHVSPRLKGEDPGALSPLSHFAFGEAAIYRRSALAELDRSMGSAVIHDASLKMLERGVAPVHIPTVLLSRPAERPSYVVDADLASASAAALARRGWGGEAHAGAFPGLVAWRPADPPSWPSVQIVIPTRDRLELLRRCVTSIERTTDYPDFSITIVDNDSAEPDTLAYLAGCGHQVVACPGGFHFPRIVNVGAAAGSERYVLILNNDTEVLASNWLKDLVRVAELPGVGVVGSVLVGDDGVVNHAGITVAGRPCQLFFPDTYPSDDAVIRSTRDVVAVTGACQLVRRDLWERLGGHDESFEVECSDIDISLRARALSLRTAVVGTSPLLHLEKRSRGELREDNDGPAFAYRWGVGAGFMDPYATRLITYSPGPRFVLVPLD